MKAKALNPSPSPSSFDWKSNASSAPSSKQDRQATCEQERANRTAIKRVAVAGGDIIKSGAPYHGT